MPKDIKPTSEIIAELGLEPNGIVQLAFTNTCYKRMSKYVPKDEGHLRINATILPNRIIYKSPYARYQYYGVRDDGSHRVQHYTTPGTGPYWDKKMWTAEGQDIVNEIQRMFRRK